MNPFPPGLVSQFCFGRATSGSRLGVARGGRLRTRLRAECLERRDLLDGKGLPVFGVPVDEGDAFEPNDDPGQATYLGVLGDLVETGLSIHEPFNDDFYRMEMAGPGVLDITVTFSHALGDIDILLLDGGANTVAVSDSVTNTERILFNVAAGETYYLLVAGFDGATNPAYDLRIDGPEGIQPDRFEPNDDTGTATDLGVATRIVESELSIHSAGDEDYFRFTTAAAGQLDIAVDFVNFRGDIDVQLLDAAFNVVSAAETINDTERVSTSVVAGETYYLRVFGYAGASNVDYRLKIDGPAATGGISGVVWDDQNGDGVRDAGEPGLRDRTVFLDDNDNGEQDAILPREIAGAATDLPRPIVDLETVTSSLDVSGAERPIQSVTVEISLAHTWLSDLTAQLVSPLGTRVELFAHVGGDGDDMMGLMLSDASPTPVALGTAPFTGLFQPLRPLDTFAGEDANGTWMLEIGDAAEGDTGELLAWSIRVVTAGYFETAVATDAEGNFHFTEVVAGDHVVAQQLPPDWEFTFPLPETTHAITVSPDATTTGIEFGNRSTATAEDAHVIDVQLGRSAGMASRYSIPVGDAAQLDSIALVGIDQISVAFDRVWDVGPDSLELHGVNVASYATIDEMFSTAAGDGDTFVATWTLAEPIEADNLVAIVRAATMGATILDGDWTNPAGGEPGGVYPSGDGTSGGDFVFRFNVLAGDVNRDGQVDRGDIAFVVANGFVDAMQGGYDVRHDLDGNGVVNVVDAVLVVRNLGASLPMGEPSRAPVAVASPAAAGAIVRRAGDRTSVLAENDRPRRTQRTESSVAAVAVQQAIEQFASDSTSLRAARIRRIR